MLTVLTWKWGNLFSASYVNRLRNMLERHLHIPHELVCITRETEGIDKRVRIVTPPPIFTEAIRCRRRVWQFAKERIVDFYPRVLAIDLDVVIVDDITPIVNRLEPLVCWRVGYANVFSGSFVLYDVGALDAMWRAYAANPISYPRLCGEQNASDQAMLNYHLRGQQVAQWKERDGFRTWFGGARYKALQHHGMGPDRPNPTPGTRIVVMGSDDKAVLDEARYPWVERHWQ